MNIKPFISALLIAGLVFFGFLSLRNIRAANLKDEIAAEISARNAALKQADKLKDELERLPSNKLFSERQRNEQKNIIADAVKKIIYERYATKKFDEIYQKDSRGIGGVIKDMAVLAWLGEDPALKKRLERWCALSFAKERWGNDHDIELTTLLFSLSLTYDWHGDSYDEAFQESLREDIYKKGLKLYEYILTHEDEWWAGSHWQNHGWINYTALLAAGMALYDDFPDVIAWINLAKEKIELILSLQHEEGSNHEGLNYSAYGTKWLIRGLALLQTFDNDIFHKSSYLKNYHKYFQAYSVDQKMETFFDLGDSPVSLWSNPAEIFLKLYGEYGNKNDLVLFEKLFAKDSSMQPDIFTAVYDFPKPQEEKSVSTHSNFEKSFFSDLGVYIEKDCADGDTCTSFLFKSGVPGGREAHQIVKTKESYNLNRSHNHPDQNHFIIWDKENFFMSDTGYTSQKLTRNHNTLTVNGRGQLGEGEQWFRDSEVSKGVFHDEDGLTEEKIFSVAEAMMLSGDAGNFYPGYLRLNKYRRNIIWIKDAGFIIYDDIRVDNEANLQLYFHSDYEMRQEEGFVAMSEGNSLKGKFITVFPKEVSRSISRHVYKAHPNKKDKEGGWVLEVSPKEKTKKNEFINYLSLKNDVEIILSQGQEGYFLLELHEGNKTYDVLINRNENGEMQFGDYTIKSKTCVFLPKNEGGSGKILLFQGARLSYKGARVWSSSKGSENQVVLRQEIENK